MCGGSFHVLLVQEEGQGTSRLLTRLENRGCLCHVATSIRQAAELLVVGRFDLVLSTLRAHPQAISSLVEILTDSRIDFFYALPVEDGCWWIEAMRAGRASSAPSALRPSEFCALLDSMINQRAAAAAV